MAYLLSSLSAADAMQAVYIGYYNRAADPYGFNYWLDFYEEHLDGAADGNAGLSLAEIANDFATQAETKSVYPFFNSPALATTANATDFLITVYDNLFERAPDAAGLAFWLDQLTSGSTPAGEIVLAIIEGAVGGDVATLDNKIAAANYWSSEASINAIGTSENPMNSVAQDEIFDAAVAAISGTGSDGFGADDLAASKDATDAFIADYLAPEPEPEPVDQTIILTADTDIVSGGEGDDTFKSNQNTLNTDDELDGKGGTDTLELSVANGAGSVFVAPTLNSIEVLEVNGPNLANGQDVTLDLSNADGYQVLRSFQNTTDGNPGGSLISFRDIQDVNGTDIEIIDTNADHRYTYDSNAFASTFGGDDDVVDILVQEVNGSTIDLALENAVPGTPGGNFRSHVDAVNLTSASRQQVNNTTSNFIQDLNVGPVFNVLNIDGDADLEIEEFLDEAVNVVDASALDATLALDLLGQGDGGLAVNGAVGSTRIDVHGDTNGMFTFQDAADLLRVGNSSDTGYSAEQVTGNLGVFMNGGDDTAILNITGEQQVSLGAGNDTLTINGDVDDLSTTTPNDGVSVVLAGAGNDSVTLNGLSQSSSNDYVVQLGSGNDTLVANQNGNHEVLGEDGQDSITINGDGDQDIDSGADNDTVTINGDGVHTVSLGGGNDALTINGSRLADNNIDNTTEDRYTEINGDAGDDTVVVNGDHLLMASLGAGSDSIELHTDELTVDDVIYGDAAGATDTEIDTLILNNNTGGLFTGLVGASDTSSVSGIDVFDLRDTNIQLELSSDNFDTALNGDIVVTTVSADHLDLPLLYPEIYNGMTRAEYEDAAVKYFGGDGVSVAESVQAMNAALINSGVTTIGIHDTNGSGDAATFVTGGETYADGSNGDTVEFQRETGAAVVDITNIPMSVLSGRNFTLEGGNVRDIVVADEASISSRLDLNFDFSTDTTHSAEDTLVVVDGATITAADLRNVNGLEIIELMSTSNDAQVWNIELNDRVINQTTGNAPLIIRVDPDVPEGSFVNIELDPSIWGATATKDVIIETVANAQIFIDGVLVTEPDYGTTDYNPGSLGSITVVPRLLFTENTDSLVGTSMDDTFIFDSISELNQADSADGLAGHDTLLADFVTVSNQGESLFEQLNAPQLTSIEEVRFDTGMNVQMTHLDGGPGLPGSNGALDGMLNTVVTGWGNDSLLDMEAIGANATEGYFLRVGDDVFTTIGQGDFDDNQVRSYGYDEENGPYYVDGGSGDDAATIRDEDDLAMGTDIEHITLEGNADATVRTILGTDGSSMTITGYDQNNNNSVTLASSIMAAAGGLATVQLHDIEDVVDNGGDNNIVMDSARGGVDGDSNVALNGGTDSLTGTEVDDLDVSATAGAKTVNVGGTGATGSVNTFDYNVGEPGNNDVDTITANVARHVDVRAAGGDDVVNVKTTDVGAGDFINNPAVYVDGGAGNDTITATSNQSWVKVDGGTGADTINVTTKTGGESTIDTGLGADGVGDTVNLYAANGTTELDGGADTIVFGNIIYDAGQNIVTGAQGTTQNFVQHGIDSAEVDGTSDSFDTIKGFNMEAGGPGAEDVLDVTAFLQDEFGGVTQIDFDYGDWRGGATPNVDAYPSAPWIAEVAVLSVDNGFVLDASHITENTVDDLGGIEVIDNGARVVITAYDTDSDGSFDTADMYFVQDVDQDEGVAWAVDHVATIEFATEIGAIISIDAGNFEF
jgi:hypothetical protein